MVTGTEPSRDAPGPDESVLFERLVAAEATILRDRYRQPAAVVGEIARLWTAGETISGIAARAGVTREIVRDRLGRAGALEGRPRCPRDELERRGAELVAAYEAGASIAALATEAGVCRGTLRTFLVARGVRLRHDRGWYRRKRHAGG